MKVKSEKITGKKAEKEMAKIFEGFDGGIVLRYKTGKDGVVQQELAVQGKDSMLLQALMHGMEGEDNFRSLLHRVVHADHAMDNAEDMIGAIIKGLKTPKKKGLFGIWR